jgi:hypothetical protein
MITTFTFVQYSLILLDVSEFRLTISMAHLGDIYDQNLSEI